MFLDVEDTDAALDFLDACRLAPAWAHVPVVVLAARDELGAARQVPAEAYLSKPFALGALLVASERVGLFGPPRTVRAALPPAPASVARAVDWAGHAR